MIALNFNSPRLGNSERQMFELVSGMYPKSKWYKHIGVVWSRYYPYLTEELKNQKLNRVEGFNRFLSKYFRDSVPANESSCIPHYFVDSIDGRMPYTESNEELNRLVSWIEKLPTMAQDLSQANVAVRTYNNTRQTTLDKGTRVTHTIFAPQSYILFGSRSIMVTVYITLEIVTEVQTCTDYFDGTSECSEWRVINRETKEVIKNQHIDEL